MRRFFKLSSGFQAYQSNSFSDLRGQATHILLLVRFFYLFLTYNFYGAFMWLSHTDLSLLPYPSWPVRLLESASSLLSMDIRMDLLAILFLLSAFIAVIRPQSFLARFVSFIGIMVVSGIGASMGGLTHNDRFVTYIVFALLFLPNKKITETSPMSQVMRVHSAYWMGQGILLFVYTMSGLWKLQSGIESFMQDDFGLFHPYGLASILAARQMETNTSPVLLDMALQLPYILWLLHMSIVYVQLCSFMVLFRPDLQRPYGIILCLFHFGTVVLMEIAFTNHIIIWSLFFVLSPYAPKRFSLRNLVLSMPLINYVLWPFIKKKPQHSKGILIYDGDCPFCTRYSRLVDIRQCVAEFELVNAREASQHPNPAVERVPSRYNLNKGMVLILDKREYFGAYVLQKIAEMSSSKRPYDIFYQYIFQTERLSKVLYPFMRFGRYLTLKILGKKTL